MKVAQNVTSARTSVANTRTSVANKRTSVTFSSRDDTWHGYIDGETWLITIILAKTRTFVCNHNTRRVHRNVHLWGWALSQLGKVLVEKRLCMMARWVSKSGSLKSVKYFHSCAVVSKPWNDSNTRDAAALCKPLHHNKSGTSIALSTGPLQCTAPHQSSDTRVS